MLQKVNETLEYIKSRTTVKPKVAIILGTGLGGLVNEIRISESIVYEEIPNFPVPTVQGHHGRLIFGNLNNIPVVAMQGRFHFYEGYSMQDITFPVRILKFLGAGLLILSNAVGGVNPEFEVGDLMIIRDHVNLMGNNPLIGKNEDRFGPRFPDMGEVYNKNLISLATKIARQLNINVRNGIYAAVSGPTYETAAEYRFIRAIGADAVGMSIVPEAIVARHMGMTCFAVSIITDLGVEGKQTEITHEEVIDVASNAEPKLTAIIRELLNKANLDHFS